MVVDLAVHYHHATVRVDHGLLAEFQVNDGEPGMGKTNVLVRPNVVFVWPPVLLDAIHAVQHQRVGVTQHASDATHVVACQDIPLKGLFKFSAVVLPKRVAEHHHHQENHRQCKTHLIGDLWWVGIGRLVGHVRSS